MSVTGTPFGDADAGLWWPLLLSTLAGLSTCVGGILAVSFAPGTGALAFLLGTAVGVMATVSAAELWFHTALETGDWAGITLAVAIGAALFALLDPLILKLKNNSGAGSEEHDSVHSAELVALRGSGSRSAVGVDSDSGCGDGKANVKRALAGDDADEGDADDTLMARDARTDNNGKAGTTLQSQPTSVKKDAHGSSNSSSGTATADVPGSTTARSAELIRLSLVMTIALTLHNLPVRSLAASKRSH